MASLRTWVSWLYTRHPILGNVIVYGTLYSAGDVSQQTIQGKPKLDYASIKRVGFLGASVFGPLYHYWFRILEFFIPGTGIRRIGKKIITDQIVGGTVGIFIFYTGLNILEGKQRPYEEAVVKGPKTFITGCLYWPAVQTVNFSLVPVKFRAVYVACAAFVWTNILCFFKSQETPDHLPRQAHSAKAP